MKRYFCAFLSFVTVLLSNGTLLFGQMNSDFFSGAVRPTLDLQRDTDRASSRSSGVTGSQRRSDAVSKAETSGKTIEAMLVSINDYQGAAGLPNLQGCNNDIRSMKSWLESYGTPSGSISVYSDDGTLSGNKPYCSALLDELRRKAKIRCDRLVVVFACHGISVGGKSFICPADTVSTDLAYLENESKEEILEAAAANQLLPVSDMFSVLKKARAKEVLLILDACRSSTEEGNFMREFTELLNDNDKNFKKSNGGSFVVLTSCSSGQSALEIFSQDGQAHGAFLYYFVDGLSGRADYAACYDGKVSLVEAYNYAYSRVSDEATRRNRRQSPEIFMTSTNGNMVLATYANPPEMKNETDIQFLMRVGIILADNRWKKSDNAVGLKALNCVLDNVPNNTLAYALRGSVSRKLGRYNDALSDLDRIGEKFQLYADGSGESNVLKQLPGSKSAETGTKLKKDALLTITRSDGDYFFVSEMNNEPLGDSAGWIHRDQVSWDRHKADGNITPTRMQQSMRSVSSNISRPGGMLAPGNVIGGGGTVSAPGPVYH